MKKSLLVSLCFAIMLPVLKAQQSETPRFKPTILVEFYTSEGCSSCPVADEFGTEIRAKADSGNMLVYTIDWHVDLWDRSGWKDPYSDSNYTARQLKMALKNNQKAMFTPMVFVNGTGALPGGAKAETGMLIQKFMRTPSQHFLLFSAGWYDTDKKIVFEYEIKGKPDSCDVFFVLVEKEIQNFVTAGENKDKTLTHHNVVRKVESSQSGTSFGSVSMQLQSNEIDFSKYRVIGFLQHKRTLQVLAVQALEFNTEKK